MSTIIFLLQLVYVKLLQCSHVMHHFTSADVHTYTHTHTHTHRLGVFQVPPWKDEDPPDFDPCLTLRLFVQYVENLLCITMEIEKDHSLIQHAAASFYEVVSKSVSRWVTGNMISICVQ